jgi:hypothetical protein
VGAGGRRDELIALVALLALAAAITVVLVFIEPSSHPLADDPGPATSATVPPGSAAAETGVLLWDDPFVYACRLLPSSDVERIFGPSGSQAYVRQQYLDRTPTPAELDGASAFAYGGVATRCTRWFDDQAGHQLDVVVTQFPSAGPVERRWRTLTAGHGHGKQHEPPAGRPVSGSDGRLLYLPDERSFLIRADTLTVEVRYAADPGDDRARPMSSRERARQVPLMQQVISAVDLHSADDSALQGPVPTSDGTNGTIGGTPYVEPCAALDAAAFEALGGPPTEPVVVDTSVIPHDPFANTAVSSCERSAAFRNGGPRQVSSTFAVLEVRVATDPAAAQEVLERHLDNRYPSRTKVRELVTDAGTAYVVELGGTDHDPLRTRAVHVVVGSYELRLAAVRDVGPKLPSGRPPTEAQLSAAVSALVEAMTAATTPVP